MQSFYLVDLFIDLDHRYFIPLHEFFIDAQSNVYILMMCVHVLTGAHHEANTWQIQYNN